MTKTLSRHNRPERLRPKQPRIAFLAGTLGRGGAEKQFFYMARALSAAGIVVRVYALEKDGAYWKDLEELGLEPVWIGRHGSRAIRIATFLWSLAKFRPHVVQSVHTYCNLYSSVAGGVVGALSVGALRSSLQHATAGNRAWTMWHLKAPSALIVNSRSAFDELLQRKLMKPDRVHFLPNVVEIRPVKGAGQEADATAESRRPMALFVGRLVRAKRADLFLRALSLARTSEPSLGGAVVGDGPERESLNALALELRLQPDDLQFLGERGDVLQLITKATMLVLSSETEGFPNVLLEAMSVGVPTIATPAGDSARIIDHEKTGYIVPSGDVGAMAAKMVELARSPALCRTMGAAGRERTAAHYSCTSLASALLEIYHSAACVSMSGNIAEILSPKSLSPTYA